MTNKLILFAAIITSIYLIGCKPKTPPIYYQSQLDSLSVVIATKDSSYEKIVSNIQEVKARNGKVVALVTEGDTIIRQLADHVLEVPVTNVVFSTLLAVIPLQLLSYHIAVMRNCNVDQPRNLAKSVTVE